MGSDWLVYIWKVPPTRKTPPGVCGEGDGGTTREAGGRHKWAQVDHWVVQAMVRSVCARRTDVQEPSLRK